MEVKSDLTTKSTGDDFPSPPAAEPFTPDAIDQEPEKDRSRTIPGLQVATPGAEAPDNKVSPEEVGPEVGKTVSLDSEPEDDKPGDEAKEPVTHCPACGCDIYANAAIIPTDEEKTRWLRHMLGEERFSSEFELLGGRVTVKFRTRLTKENDEIFNQLGDDISNGLIPEAPAFGSPAYIARMQRFMFVCSLERLDRQLDENTAPKSMTYPLITADAYPAEDGTRPILTAHDRITGEMDEGFLGALMAAHRRFESLTVELLRHSEEADFWKPAGETT